MPDKRVQALAFCILFLALGGIALVLGLVLSDNGGLRKNFQNSTELESDDHIYREEPPSDAFPDEEFFTKPVHIENNDTDVSRGYQLFGAISKDTTSTPAPTDDPDTKTFSRGATLDFTFSQAGRPTSIEIDALVAQTEEYLSTIVYTAWTVNFVDLEIFDMVFPTPVAENVAQYKWSMSFLTGVTVRETSIQDGNDFSDLLSTLDFNGEYKENYAKSAVTGNYQIFASTTDVVFEPAR